jgi:hypothetical protein
VRGERPEPPRRLVEHVEALAAGEADEVSAVLRAGVEDLVGDGDDAASLR